MAAVALNWAGYTLCIPLSYCRYQACVDGPGNKTGSAVVIKSYGSGTYKSGILG